MRTPRLSYLTADLTPEVNNTMAIYFGTFLLHRVNKAGGNPLASALFLEAVAKPLARSHLLISSLPRGGGGWVGW